MRRILVAAIAAALGAGIATSAFDGALGVLPDASALTSGDIAGRYNVGFKGDAWIGRVRLKGDGPPIYKTERIVGHGKLEIAARDATVNDGLVTVRVLLDEPTRKSALGVATPVGIAFEGTAAIVGQSIAVISSGQPNFVNALTLRFDKLGQKVSGSWMANYPALERDLATQKFAAGVTVAVTGRRARRDAAATPR